MNVINPHYRRACMLGQGPDLTAVDLILVAVDADQFAGSPDGTGLEFLSDIGGEVTRTGALDNVAVTADGRLTSDPEPLPDPGAGQPDVEHVYMVHDTGVPATSRILAQWTEGIAGAPLTPDGVNDMIQAAGANGYFRL